MFEFKFGTPEPVRFRERWPKEGIDLDLEARFAAKCEVFDYDASRYDSEETVISQIKANGPEMIAKCLNEDWPENTSVVKGFFKELDGLFDQELERRGIKAHTEFFSKVLTSDSKETYKNAVSALAYNPSGGSGWDHVCSDAIKQNPSDGRYQVKFSNSFMHAKGGQVFFAPGEQVEVECGAVASDTSYQFSINAPDVKYEYGSIIKITFTMPEHDVMISLGSTPYGPPMNLFENQMREFASKDMNSGEWKCLRCNARNTGKFCTECGSPKPGGPEGPSA